MDLSVELGRLKLKNPVTVASGTYGYAEEYSQLNPVGELGGIFTKAVTAEPREGNPGPRVIETTAGMINAVGLANVGVEAFIRDKMPFLRSIGTSIFINVAGAQVEDYCRVTEKLESVDGIAGLEINISCPNVKEGGLAFGSDPQQAYRLLSVLRNRTRRFLIAKLSPNVADITQIAAAAVEAGCDGLSLINTLVAMAIDVKTRRPKLANITGGLSGPAVKPVGVALVYKVASKFKVPIIGIGGILTAEDALEYILAGACAVQIGTGNFIDPQIPRKVIAGIEEYCRQNGLASVKEIVGSVRIDN